MRDPDETFDAFWHRYLQAHANPRCRALHYAASAWSLACLAALAATGSLLWLLAGIVGAYGLAWAGHFFVEGNRPLAFTRPAWSLVADFRMFFLALGGRLRPHLERAAVGPMREVG